jgi:PEGA domain-containing protein
MASTARDRRPSHSAEAIVVAGPPQPKPRWFSGVSAMFRSRSAQRAAEPNTNELFAFPSESAARNEPAPPGAAPEPTREPALRRPGNRLIATVAVVAAGVAVGAGIVVLRRIPMPVFSAPAPQTGNLTIETQPAGSEVRIDGEQRGVTPVTVTLVPGAHTVTIRSDGDERVVPLTIAAGAEVTQHFEMRPRDPAALFGRVSVVTDPPGAKVAVDGHLRGLSPIVVGDLIAEEHTVTVTNDSGSAARKVVVTPAGTASVVFSLAGKASGPVGGWLAVSSPFDVEVVENNDVVGSSRASRIMLAAGRHEVVLASRSLGYQDTRKIDVTAGRTTTIRVEAPQVSVSLNARPWAEITMDGAAIGQTPIANLLVTIGPHDLVFRNPQLGERRQTVLVTANGPNRIAADLTK